MDKIGTIRELLEKLQGYSPSGFAVALHVQFTTPRFLFQSYDREWMDLYSAKGLVMHDPTVRWGLENAGMVDWADLAANDPADVMGQARAHGLAHGLTLSVVEGDSKSVGSFSRGDRPFTGSEKDKISDLFRDLHLATLSVTDGDRDLEDMLKRLSVDLTHR